VPPKTTPRQLAAVTIAFSLVAVTGTAGRAQTQAPAKEKAKAPELKVPDTVIFERGVEYANPDGQHLKLDLARPKTGDGPFPVVLCIHGGGFRAGSREGYDGLCVRLAEHGYAAATVSYRLAPRYKFPAAVLDVKAAVRWLRAHASRYNLDPDKIGVTGGSAGGHLAQFLGVTGGSPEFEGDADAGSPGFSSRVNCVVNVYGPSDFTKSYGKSVDAAEVLPLWLGGDLKTARARHVMASPLTWAGPGSAPTLCIHGTDDKYVAHEQSVWLVDRLKAAGVEAELLTIEGAGHGFKGDDAKKAEAAMIAFFDRHLKPKAVAGGPPPKPAATAAPLPDPSKIKPALYATGFTFAEGPAVDRAGNLYVVNYRERGTIGKITPSGAASVFIDLRKHLPSEGNSQPSCNGLKVDDDGNLIAAETGTSQVIRISKDGKKVDVLAREVGGERLRGLNDVALDPAGNVYFSNPGQKNVYRWNRADGSVDKLNAEPIGSNGIGLTPDGKHLVTADSGGRRLMILDMVDGKGTNPRVLCELTSPELPDGFVFDEAGRLYLGTWTGGSVAVIEVPSGKRLATYDAGGSQATNVHFTNGDLYVTVAAKEAVFKLPLGIRGWRYSRGCGY
jgi:acetyl esterase/lipase/sugar lactone lactonase YvrE